MIRKLQKKFVLINMSIVTVMLLVIFALVLHSTWMEMDMQNQQAMQMILEEGSIPSVRPGEWGEQVQLPFFYAVVSPSGKVLSLRGGYFDLSDTQRLETIISQALQESQPIGMLREYNLSYCRRGTRFGQAIVFLDVSSQQAALEVMGRTCLIIGVLSFFAFFLLSFWLARWAIGPVEKAWNQQRQFVADASHELKTPLTVITTNAELLQSPDYGQQEKEQFSGSILTMARQMRGLVEGLLDLARVDNGAARMEFVPLDLSELTAEAVLPFEPVFFERGLTLETSIAPGIQVRGSAVHLKQVADILLDNAAKYSSPQGRVMLTLSRQGSRCLLSVASSGQTISKADLKNIFRRFYRLDQARTMNRSYGLGLSIADSIVSEHGGKIWAQSSEGINTFFVSLAVIYTESH